MKRSYILPTVSVVGVLIIIAAVAIDAQRKPAAAPTLPPPTPPFASFVAGPGIVEAHGGDIAIGTPVAGVVQAIYVQWGQQVSAGDALFAVDDSDLRAQLPVAKADVNEARAKLARADTQLKVAENVPDRRAVSPAELADRRAAVAVAQAAVASALARIERIQLQIKRCTVRAPVAGKILAIDVRLGEFAQDAVNQSPLMILGRDDRLQLRVDVDEYDAARVRPGAPAVAFLRGNAAVRIPLTFQRIDPYIVPKTSLTGSSTERVDTRVLQVIYDFPPDARSNATPSAQSQSTPMPTIYVGQQMDVYIQASSDDASLAANSPDRPKS